MFQLPPSLLFLVFVGQFLVVTPLTAPKLPYTGTTPITEVASFVNSQKSKSNSKVRIGPLAASAIIDQKTSIQETSDELFQLLQQKNTVSKKTDSILDHEINARVQTLIASKSPFDPRESIDGPLFATIHFIGNTPLWEKIGSGGVRNIKGQKYTLTGESSGSFVNYAEVFGRNFYLKAVGDFQAIGPISPVSDVEERKSSSGNPLDIFATLFRSGNKQLKSDLLPTPFDYEAKVTGASIVLLEKFPLNLSIEGTGTVRVLYANKKLRIFLSPTDTNVTRGGGDWESEGLIVVQVRADLVFDDWLDSL